MRQYLASLERVLTLRPSRLLPAHGPSIDEPEPLIRSYLGHRRMREVQVIRRIEAGDRTVEAIAESIYHGLESRLMAAARETVRAHLAKLEADGIATYRDGWHLR
jgi:glyoxylase-like metal-dependent hydrolase (beta-lactamase superfamily II)